MKRLIVWPVRVFARVCIFIFPKTFIAESMRRDGRLLVELAADVRKEIPDAMVVAELGRQLSRAIFESGSYTKGDPKCGDEHFRRVTFDAWMKIGRLSFGDVPNEGFADRGVMHSKSFAPGDDKELPAFLREIMR